MGFAKSARTADAAETAETAKTAIAADAATTAQTATSANSADVAKAVTPNAVTGAGVADGSLLQGDFADGAVGTMKLADNAITAPKIASDSVNGTDIVDDGITVVDLAPNSVSARQLQPSSVDGSSVGFITTVVGQGTLISAGNSGEAVVECPAPAVLLAGGFAWQDEEANSILYSAPSGAGPPAGVDRQGARPGGQQQALRLGDLPDELRPSPRAQGR